MTLSSTAAPQAEGTGSQSPGESAVQDACV
jgi:hypothetical protein